MRSGWVKHFIDGSQETGYDEEVQSKRASWRHGKLDELVSVELKYLGRIVVLSSQRPRRFWQADTVEARLRKTSEGKPVTVTRFLQRHVYMQLQQSDIGLYLNHKTAGRIMSFMLMPQQLLGSLRRVTVDDVGKWIHVMLDVKKDIKVEYDICELEVK